MESSKYYFYKENNGNNVWWAGNANLGEFVFSFDRKKVFNLFADYPFKLSVKEWKVFNDENEYWKEFFSERNDEYEIQHADEIMKLGRENK